MESDLMTKLFLKKESRRRKWSYQRKRCRKRLSVGEESITKILTVKLKICWVVLKTMMIRITWKQKKKKISKHLKEITITKRTISLKKTRKILQQQQTKKLTKCRFQKQILPRLLLQRKTQSNNRIKIHYLICLISQLVFLILHLGQVSFENNLCSVFHFVADKILILKLILFNYTICGDD